MKASLSGAIDVINEQGACLVFPIDNRPAPLSLWRAFYPRTPMRWEWDAGGDNRVPKLWHLREELSRSGEVVYSKWFRGRATFFSKDAFRHLIAYQATRLGPLPTRAAKDLLEALEDRSPLSTKQLKRATDLVGRDAEPLYQRSLKELWIRGLIVAWGEIDDGAFPSLAIGATRHLFEELWGEAQKLKAASSEEWLRKKWGEKNLFWKFAQTKPGPRKT